MSESILDIYFDINISIPVSVILEAGENTWTVTQDIATKLIGSIPGRLHNLYFLGNPTCYSVSIPRDFQDKGPGWFAENKGRVTLVSPILERLQNEKFNGMIVIICSTLPVDMDDWQGSEVSERILVVTTKETTLGCNYKEINSTSGTESITRLLDNPVKELFIKGTGFVPLCFEVKSVKVVIEDGIFRLMIPPLTDKCHIKALCLEELPLLYIKREKGEVQNIKPSKERPWFELSNWQEIPQGLKPIIHAGISKQDFECPQCKKAHPYDTFVCPLGGPILQGLPLSTCILFKKEKYLSITDSLFAYPLKNNQKIVTKEGELYEWKDKLWKSINKISPYEEVDDGVWAVFNKI